MKHHKGQSFIEYTVMAVLIMLGISVMGPYVLRSVNAHYKLWGEAIDDSVNDRMPNINAIGPPTNCTCSALTPGNCGARGLAGTQCQANQRLHYTPCSPDPTCGIGTSLYQEQCVNDATCCDYNACNQGNCTEIITNNACGNICGTIPLPASGPRSTVASCPTSTTVPGDASAPALLPSVPDPNNSGFPGCYVGEEVLINQCTGGVPPRVACRANPICAPKCGALPVDATGVATATFCPGAQDNLTQETPVTLLGSCQTFDTPGTSHWQVPPGMTNAMVYVWGAGGGGAGGATGSGSYDGGGGGGGGLTMTNVPLQNSQTYTITVSHGGAGGAAGTSTVKHGSKGGDGGISSFVSNDAAVNISAAGGHGGDTAYSFAGGPTINGGLGGNIFNCTGAACQNYAGGNGGSAYKTDSAGCAGGGGGGGGAAGTTTYDSTTRPCTHATAGADATIPLLNGGAGGSNSNHGTGTEGTSPGGGGAGSGNQTAGGDGADGMVKICGPTSCTTQKCLAYCNEGYSLQINSDGTSTCVKCQTIASFVNTTQNAGGSVEYTSPMSSTPVPFTVKVFTEDLNFIIIFKDANGNEIHTEECYDSTKTPLPGLLDNSCGGRDADDNIDSYTTTYTANQVYVKVKEGGNLSSKTFGYDITSNCAVKKFSYGPISQRNKHYRILGSWNNCTLTECKKNSGGAPGYCKLSKASVPIVLATEPPKYDSAGYTTVADRDRHTTCTGSGCMYQYRITDLAGRTAQTNEWYLFIRLGDNDSLKKATVQCSN
ncbi:MAG: hypothetical protein HY209_00890 [Candidatus Omnitrophica bacterium]|nr:hypothetical protein [Candidatus Omnitrophota bacterium]